MRDVLLNELRELSFPFQGVHSVMVANKTGEPQELYESVVQAFTRRKPELRLEKPTW